MEKLSTTRFSDSMYVLPFLVVAGFLLNLLPFRLLGENVFFLGGVFYLFVALVYGPVPGACSALLVSLGAVVRGEPWLALPVFALEAYWLGWSFRRGKQPIFSILLYWLVLGGPLYIGLVLWLAHFPTGNDWFHLLKLMLNGVVGAVVAGLFSLFAGSRLKPAGAPRPPLSDYLFYGLILLTSLPLLLANYTRLSQNVRQEVTEAGEKLSDASRVVQEKVDDYLQKHAEALVAFSGTLPEYPLPAETLNRTLAHLHRTYPGFVSVLIADPSGGLLAAHPLTTLDGNRAILEMGLSIAERDYFYEALAGEGPFISAAFRGRGFGESPIVAVSAPLRNGSGTVAGIVEGSLNLSRFKTFENFFRTLPRAAIVISDENNRVVYAGKSTGYQPLDSLANERLENEIETRDAGSVDEVLAKIGRGTGEAPFLMASTTLKTKDWRVTIRQSGGFLIGKVRGYFLWTTFGMLAILAGCMVLAKGISALITRPMRILATHSHELAVGERGAEKLAVPEYAPREVATLVRDLEGMANRIRESHRNLKNAIGQKEALNRELEQVIADQDAQVKSRTADLARAMEDAQAASKAKTEFLANTSHEFRTPLAGIIGMSEILMKTSMTPRQRECGEAILDSAQILLSLINGVLDFAELEAGKLQLVETDFSVQVLVRQLSTMFHSNAAAKGLALHFEVSPELGETRFMGDAARLRLIVGHLIDNAVKFTEKGRIDVSFERERSAAGDRWLHISVRDTGIGIDMADQAIIVAPFSQADGSSSRRAGGAGLGLTICKRMVELMGGWFGFSSKPGVGSDFFFKVPLKKVEPAAVHPVSRKDSATGPCRILVAEDNPINRKIVLSHLKNLGYRTFSASDGKQVLDFLAEHRVDLILMDCQMPEMDGYQATREIRKTENPEERVIILALTAHAMSSDRDKCLAAGMDGYLVKPIGASQLASSIGIWLKRGVGEPGTRAVSEPYGKSGVEGAVDPALFDTLVGTAGTSNKNFAHEIIELYLAEAPRYLERIERAMEHGQDRELSKAAHALKGGSAQIGAIRLSPLAGELETAARLGERHAYSDWYQKIVAEMDRVQAAFRAMLQHPQRSD